jgi:hypothetical protein
MNLFQKKEITFLGAKNLRFFAPKKVKSAEENMDEKTRISLNNLQSEDKDLQYAAFIYILEVTEKPVDWAYAVWDALLARLSDKDNHQRAIAAQILANLASSDPQNRMLRDFAALLAVTRDERFVTARHTLQSIWKVGRAGKVQQKLVVDGLAGRFNECAVEKNCTLIRYDIIQDFRNLYDEIKDESVRQKALALIATEEDLKYRKKYASVWKKVG